MELHDLQKQLTTNKLQSLYVFTGPEVGIMDIYFKQFENVSGIPFERVDTVEEAVLLATRKKLSTSQHNIIVQDDKDYLKNEKVWTRVKELLSRTSNVIILKYTSIDKRSKFWKSHSDESVVFEKLSPEVLAKYIDKELPGMTEKERIAFAEICDCDYSRILLECDKVRQYSRGLNFDVEIISVDYWLVIEDLVKQGVISRPIGDITFLLTDAIVTRDVKETAKYLAQAKAKQESEILTLSVLYNSFKHILMVQGLGSDQSEPVKRTGLTAWQVKMAKEKQGYYSLGELTKALMFIRFAEKSIKTGKLDAAIAVDYVIVNIM